MKIRKSKIDNLAYVALVIFSMGIAWLLRILITQAIRCAFEKEE